MTELINTYLPLAMTLVGILAFIVSMIVEVTKGSTLDEENSD